MVVFGYDDAVEIRTYSMAATHQPLYIRLQNVQMASVNSPDARTRAMWHQVPVDESHRGVSINGAVVEMRVLESFNSFSFSIWNGTRRLDVAGRIEALDSIDIIECDDLTRLTA